MPFKSKEQRLAYQRAWLSKHRSENPELHVNKHRHRRRAAFLFLKKFKESKPCSDCGISYPYFVMQFDHIGVGKKANVAAMASGGYSEKAMLEEISKCELVCANCHAIRTFERKSGIK